MECLLHSQSPGSDPKPHTKTGTVGRTCIPDTLEVERSVSSLATQKVQGQSQIDEAMSQK